MFHPTLKALTKNSDFPLNKLKYYANNIKVLLKYHYSYIRDCHTVSNFCLLIWIFSEMFCIFHAKEFNSQHFRAVLLLFSNIYVSLIHPTAVLY